MSKIKIFFTAPPLGTDAYAILHGIVSVTPLFANYSHVPVSLVF